MFLVEALIVAPHNSQNHNFTKSYADETTIRFENAKVIKGIREGYKRYDADDNLLETIEDQPLSIAETDTLMQTQIRRMPQPITDRMKLTVSMMAKS